MKTSFFFLFFLLFSLIGCERIIYDVDNPIKGLPTIVLMHRGNGDNTDFVENTLAAAEYGLSIMDGIELDIQMSNDGTLWLGHEDEVHDCDDKVIGCFQEMTDQQITDAAECDGVVKYHTLESVFELMSTKYPDSYISLDMKTQSCQILSIPSVMKRKAESVENLVAKYNMQYKVFVESNSFAFMDVIADQNEVGQCIISLSDIDKGIADARATGARGISHKYTADPVDADDVSLIHRKGYWLVLWVINEPEDIVSVWKTHPDIIQTDNSDFKKYIPAEQY